MTAPTSDGFLRAVRLERDGVERWDPYPFSIPAIRELTELPLDVGATFFVGDFLLNRETFSKHLLSDD